MIEVVDDPAQAFGEVVRVRDRESPGRFGRHLQPVLRLPHPAVPIRQRAAEARVIEETHRRVAFLREVPARDVAARIDRIGRDVRPPHRVHHVDDRVGVEFDSRGFDGRRDVARRVREAALRHVAGRRHRAEDAAQILPDALRHQHERLAPQIVAREHPRGVLQRLVRVHVVVELFDALRGLRSLAVHVVHGQNRPGISPPARHRVDRREERRTVFGHFDVVVAAREQDAHRRLRSEIAHDRARDLPRGVRASFKMCSRRRR